MLQTEDGGLSYWTSAIFGPDDSICALVAAGRFDGNAGSGDRKAASGGALGWSTGSGCRKHDHFRSDFHPLIKVHDVLIGQPDTAGRNPLPDRIGLVGAIGQALTAFMPNECANYFENAGYAST